MTKPTDYNKTRVAPQAPLLAIKRMYADVKMPFRGTSNSIGLDLHAFLLTESGRPNTALIPPKSTRGIPTGIIAAPPPNHALFVCSRSGLAKQNSIFVTNSPGVIDPDYRGEIIVLLYNGGHEAYYVRHNDRIGQLVCLPVAIVEMAELPNMDLSTKRGSAGFGSTGR
jgi:dUTP pyrophosphatase